MAHNVLLNSSMQTLTTSDPQIEAQRLLDNLDGPLFSSDSGQPSRKQRCQGFNARSVADYHRMSTLDDLTARLKDSRDGVCNPPPGPQCTCVELPYNYPGEAVLEDYETFERHSRRIGRQPILSYATRARTARFFTRQRRKDPPPPPKPWDSMFDNAEQFEFLPDPGWDDDDKNVDIFATVREKVRIFETEEEDWMRLHPKTLSGLIKREIGWPGNKKITEEGMRFLEKHVKWKMCAKEERVLRNKMKGKKRKREGEETKGAIGGGAKQQQQPPPPAKQPPQLHPFLHGQQNLHQQHQQNLQQQREADAAQTQSRSQSQAVYTPPGTILALTPGPLPPAMASAPAPASLPEALLLPQASLSPPASLPPGTVPDMTSPPCPACELLPALPPRLAAAAASPARASLPAASLPAASLPPPTSPAPASPAPAPTFPPAAPEIVPTLVLHLSPAPTPSFPSSPSSVSSLYRPPTPNPTPSFPSVPTSNNSTYTNSPAGRPPLHSTQPATEADLQAEMLGLNLDEGEGKDDAPALLSSKAIVEYQY